MLAVTILKPISNSRLPRAKTITAEVSPARSRFNKPIWLSVSEAAKLGGVQGKTVRRAIKADGVLTYKIVKNRYQIELGSLVIFLNRNTKLQNKLKDFGLGQYVSDWK